MAEETDCKTIRISNLKGLETSTLKQVINYAILLCSTHQPLPAHQILLKLEKNFC